MLETLVLVCSLSLTPNLAACDEANALYVMRLPMEVASPAACLMLGQAYLAGTSLIDAFTADERLKVLCIENGV